MSRPGCSAGHRGRFAGALLAASVFGGCDAGSNEDMVPLREVDAGVETVRHGGLADYGRPVFAVESLLAIGHEGGASEYSFGSVAGVDVMSDGTIAVLDGLAGEVRTFAPDGSFVRRIGRRGEGPGEISGEGALALVAVAPRRFLLPDVMTQALNVYSLDDDLSRSARFDIQQLYMPEWRTTDDLRSFEKPDMVVSGWMFTPEFTVYRDGEAVRTVSWDHEAAGLTQQEQDAVLEIMASGVGTDAASIPDEFRAQLRLPDELPAMADIEVARGLVLVQRVRSVAAMDLRVIYTFKAAGFGGPIWDVFSLDGNYLGELDMGARADVLDIRGDTIVGVRENDAGLQQVFLARLPSGLR